jgi:cysteine desulfurase/selenocysteine lyase
MASTDTQPLHIDRPPARLASVRDDFPIFQRTVHDQPLTYLDSAATAQKPQAVIDAITRFYSHDYGTVRRGTYLLSQNATGAFEGVRAKAASFFNAASPDEIVFVRGTTEAINLVAHSLARLVQDDGPFLQEGDEVLISAMEHHANIVPWQLIREQTGIVLKVIPMDDRGVLMMDEYDQLLTERTKIVSVVHIANSLGTINPIKEIAAKAHAAGALVLVDGAQSAPHLPVDVQDLGCDFYACSGHKMLGPTGIGVLYGKHHLLQVMPPFQGGGEMIDKVTFAKTTFDDPPHRFEAGTPAIADVIGLGAAIDYLEGIGLETIAAWDRVLVAYAEERLRGVRGIRIIGEAPEKSGLVAFVHDTMHPFDLGTILDRAGVAIRVGHHCAQPVMEHFGVTATARVSFNLYNHREDIDRFMDGLAMAADMLE